MKSKSRPFRASHAPRPTRKTVFCVFGTRPEAIKMAPVVLALQKRPSVFRVRVLVTAQHRDMLDQVLKLFRLKVHYDLNVMKAGQSLTDVTALVLKKLEPIFRADRPDLVLVHGDTTTTLAATLAAFYQKIPVGHVEAGLRSFDIHNPFPEEINRRLSDAVCALHFAPTATARKNLRRENTPPDGIFITGNTGIDALHIGLRRMDAGRFALPSRSLRRLAEDRFILITAHRRENFGPPLEDFCRAVSDVARLRPDVHFVYPVHPNPNVSVPVRRRLADLDNVHLLPPLDYAQFIWLMRRAYFILTDSGGIQEEAPSLGKPVLVLRKVTERPEAVQAGTVRIVGTDTGIVKKWILRLLNNQKVYQRMANAVNPYGDGRAAERTARTIEFYFGKGRKRPSEFK